MIIKLRERKDGIIETLKNSIAEYEQRLQDAPEEDRGWMENIIESNKKRIEELSK